MTRLFIGELIRSLTPPAIALLIVAALGVCWLLRKRKALLLAVILGLSLGWHYLYVRPIQAEIKRQLAAEAWYWRARCGELEWRLHDEADCRMTRRRIERQSEGGFR